MVEKLEQNRNGEEEREKAIEYGKEILEKQGINPDDYRQYFELLQESDAPVGNSLPQFPLIEQGIVLIDDAIESWERVKSIYENIDPEKYDKNTGRKIIEEMTELVDRFHQLLLNYKRIIEDAPEKEIPPPSEELQKTRERILELAKQHGQLPAYIAYRWVGRFELNPEGKRGFEIKKD